jgi:large conductance mechanosensitive channel
MKNFFKDFATFISKGNAMDLAVGLVIGTAFNTIIKSLVNDIIMPFIGLVANTDVSNWFWVMKGDYHYDSVVGTWIFDANAIVLRYGNFLQSVLDFFIVALAIFLALRVITSLRAKMELAKVKLLKTEKAINDPKVK